MTKLALQKQQPELYHQGTKAPRHGSTQEKKHLFLFPLGVLVVRMILFLHAGSFGFRH
jgi:hypothetical protein